jgi:hypothetical protein
MVMRLAEPGSKNDCAGEASNCDGLVECLRDVPRQLRFDIPS